MTIRKRSKTVLPLALLLASLHTSAGILSDEQDKLSRYEQAYENHLVAIEDIENEIFGYTNKVTAARADLEAAEKELEAASEALAQARQDALSTPGKDADRVLKKATHSQKMASRGVRSRTKRLERVEGNLTQLQAQLAEQQGLIDEDKRRIQEQQERIITVRANLDRQAKERKAQEVAQARAKAEAAKKAQQKPKPPVIAKPKPVAEPVPVPKPEPKVVAKPKPKLTELDKEALAFAQKEVARLEKLLADGSPGRPIFKRLVLKGNRTEPVNFTFLGQNQYRAEVAVNQGKQIFEIGKHKYRRTIPASDQGETYVFIFDAKRPSRPRMVMFKKSLLDHQ